MNTVLFAAAVLLGVIIAIIQPPDVRFRHVVKDWYMAYVTFQAMSHGIDLTGSDEHPAS